MNSRRRSTAKRTARNKRRRILRLKAARKYISAGFKLVLLQPKKKGDSRSGKLPATAHGVNDASTDIGFVATHLRKQPRAGLALAMGGAKRWVCLDIDARSGGYDTLKNFEKEHGCLPQALTYETGGGGEHRIFRLPEGYVPRKGAKMPGIDVLFESRYAVAPPTMHGSGKRYKWRAGCSLDEIRPVLLPESLLKFIFEPDRSASKTSHSPRDQRSAVIIPEGQRNTTLTSAAGKLRADGLEEEEIRKALSLMNLKCAPPLSEDEVNRIAESVCRYPAKNTAEQSEEPARIVLRDLLDRDFAGGRHLLFAKDGQFWAFDGRRWGIMSLAELDARIIAAIDRQKVRGPTVPLMGQVRALLRPACVVSDDRLRFLGKPPPAINVKNGELWLSEDGTFELRRHDPKSYLRSIIDVEYDPSATCPLYDRAIMEIFANAENPKALVRHWNEFVGYLLTSDRSIPIICVLLGGGDNGKGTLLQLIIALLGDELVSASAIEHLAKSRFALGSLLGKHVVIDDDVRAGARLPDGMLKTISEAKVLTGERKNGPHFNFICRAVPIMCCNNVPSLTDLSYGMMRRLMIIPFDRTFRDGVDKDPTLFSRIVRTELPGVLNRALAGYTRIQQRGGRFKYPSALRQAQATWLTQANPLPGFVEERCVRDPNGRCLLADFYDAFRTWATSMGLTMHQQAKSVKLNLISMGFAAKKQKHGIVLFGIRLNRG